MINKKSTWRHNKLLSGRNRYYGLGSFLKNNLFNKETEGENKGKVTDTSFGNLNSVGTGLISAGGNAVGSLIGGGLESGAGNFLSGAADIAGAIPGPWGAVASAGLKVIGGVTDALWGSKMNAENIAQVEGNINQLNSFKSDASDFDSLSANWENAVTGMTFDDSFIGKDGVFAHKAADKAKELRRQVEEGQAWVNRSLTNNADNITQTQMDNLLANYTAFGGQLNTQGADFTNGLLHINNGGTHEQNPNEGVQMGVDPEGIPNLVEEGETIFNDYVFSKRMNVPKQLRDKYKLGKLKTLSFADASKKMAKESEERPNDPISQRGLEAMMTDLAQTQEMERVNLEAMKQQQQQQFAYGGPKGNMFSGPGISRNDLQTLFNDDTGDYSTYKSGSKWETDVNNAWKGKLLEWLKNDWDTPAGKEWRKRYLKELQGLGKTVEDSKLTYELLSKNVSDNSWGNWSNALVNMKSYNPIATTERYLRPAINAKDKSGNPQMPTAITVPTNLAELGYTEDEWLKANGYTLAYTPDLSYGNNGPVQKLFYTKGTDIGSGSAALPSKYFIQDGNGDPVEWKGTIDELIAKGYTNKKSEIQGDDAIRYIYAKEAPKVEYEELPTDLRYTPAVAQGIAALSDAVGWTNKPDYSLLAPLETAVNNIDYKTVKYNPIGNYLSYKPVDQQHLINQINATAGANRRSLLNTAGGNRGTAAALLLASDNNYLNQIGELGIKAENENWERRKAVEDFNRSTNMTNSQGYMSAAQTNAQSYAAAQQARIAGLDSISKYKQAIKDASDTVKSSNLSGFITSLGNIGKENMGWNWRNFGIASGTWAPGSERIDGKKAKKGGKIKRTKKGLTY